MSEISDDEEIHGKRLTASVVALRLHVLSLLHDKKDESLIAQSRVRSRLSAPRNLRSRNTNSLRRALSDEKLKCGISTAMSLFVQSQVILGKSTLEHHEGLLQFQRFIINDWNEASALFLVKFRNVLRRSLVRPPPIICVANPILTPVREHQPKRLRFDNKQRRRQLMELSRSVLADLRTATQALLQQRLESPCDDTITAKLEAREAQSDVLQLWTDLMQRQKASSDEALDLFHEALHQPDPVDTVLWNFVYFVSLSDAFKE